MIMYAHYHVCSLSCNVSNCNYDNLMCLQENNCYFFMLGDGNCNSACPSDPDCSTDDSNDGNYYLIIVILIPILGGILM